MRVIHQIALFANSPLADGSQRNVIITPVPQLHGKVTLLPTFKTLKVGSTPTAITVVIFICLFTVGWWRWQLTVIDMVMGERYQGAPTLNGHASWETPNDELNISYRMNKIESETNRVIIFFSSCDKEETYILQLRKLSRIFLCVLNFSKTRFKTCNQTYICPKHLSERNKPPALSSVNVTFHGNFMLPGVSCPGVLMSQGANL